MGLLSICPSLCSFCCLSLGLLLPCLKWIPITDSSLQHSCSRKMAAPAQEYAGITWGHARSCGVTWGILHPPNFQAVKSFFCVQENGYDAWHWLAFSSASLFFFSSKYVAGCSWIHQASSSNIKHTITCEADRVVWSIKIHKERTTLFEANSVGYRIDVI